MAECVLVTGASRGIGREVARLLKQLQYDVLGVHRTASVEAEALGAEFRLLRADLTDPPAIDALVHDLALGAAPLSGVVLNAGIRRRGSFIDSGEGLHEQLHANLESPLLLLRGLLKENVLGNPCSVVFVGSNLAQRGIEGAVAYSAAKGGIEAAVRALARELGPAGVRVNAVAPGLIRTDMTADLAEDVFDAYAASVPLGRVGEAQDVAPLVAFLLGPEAGYLTGQTITIDGGWSV